jgi:hypothetical protein
MSTQEAAIKQETSVEASATRCRCSNPHNHIGSKCSVGEVVYLGLMSYSHTDPVKNFLGQFRVKWHNIKYRKARRG